ncbi:MAG: hypothetical protein J7500_18355 [Sphingomonas sp.]|uniref:hypothetical protein n=1 Tax=Sphingomonas sp. TaxID=28214 RepID=UPI001B0A8C66|nr:hypothetical protein [Sphingomonas sp.]MBO9624675.1 hypothetical protein [Sphingomonas sp.]
MRLRSRRIGALIGFVALAGVSGPALAGWKLIPAGKPLAVDAVTITPKSDWNRASARPGKRAVALTHDGFDLDRLEIFSGIGSGEPLYRERSRRRNPMPKFRSGMLPTDLADLFERSFRVANNLTDFTVESVTPADFGGHRGIALRYSFSLPEDRLVRQGVARLVIVRGKLYAANFHAPRLHYFPSRLAEVQATLDGARF